MGVGQGKQAESNSNHTASQLRIGGNIRYQTRSLELQLKHSPEQTWHLCHFYRVLSKAQCLY